MIKKLMTKTSFWLAISNFLLAFVFIFKGGKFNLLISFIWFVNFVLNLNIASKEALKNDGL